MFKFYGFLWYLKTSMQSDIKNFCICRLRLYDLRQPFPTQVLGVHPHKVTCVQMDEWKVISGGDDGYIYGSVHYWDRRMGKQLWHLTNRYVFL